MSKRPIIILDHLTIHFIARNFPTTALSMWEGEVSDVFAGHICAECIVNKATSDDGRWRDWMSDHKLALGTRERARRSHGDRPACVPCGRPFTFLTQEALCTASTA